MKTKPTTALSDYVCIPAECRAIPLSIFGITARLRHVLECQGFQQLGDLHGLRISRVRQFRNCAKQTIRDLENLIAGVHGTKVTAQEFSQLPPPAPPTARQIFTVAPRAHDLSLKALPISRSLEQVLERLGVQHLGELAGLSLRQVKVLEPCEAATLGELGALLARAEAGEFHVPPALLDPLPPLDLLTQLEMSVLELPDGQRDGLLAQLGGTVAGLGPPPAVAKRSLTPRNQNAYLTRLTVSDLVRRGGPRIQASLDTITLKCQQNLHPLTPELLAAWLPRPWPLRFPPAFFVRLLGLMHPDLPAWPRGQEIKKNVTQSLPRIAEGLALALLRRTGPLPLTQIFPVIQRTAGAQQPGALDFLLALKHSRDIRVLFPQPDRPEADCQRHHGTLWL